MSKQSDYKLDKVDREILSQLLKNSRKSYQDIAKELIVSGGTIHVRLNKMRDAGIIKGSKVVIDYGKLGLLVTSFVGINLVSAKDYGRVLKELEAFPEVVEVHYTTGQYSLFIKIMVESTSALHIFLIEKLQALSGIQSTDTLISLDNPVERDGELPAPVRD